MSDLLGLEAVSLGRIVIRSPPIYMGGASDEISPRHAPRRRMAYAQEAAPARYEELRARLLKLCEAEGRT